MGEIQGEGEREKSERKLNRNEDLTKLTAWSESICAVRIDWHRREKERERLNVIFIFLKVHLGDSNRQPQSSRENLE